jgi:HD-GYP domain-containing protein (c-di-GMP phosphodiesterase class II)
MKVHPSQLIPGTILLQDVKGKSTQAIMKENTVLTDELITVLERFYIESVDVSSKLENGKPFMPNERQEDKKEKLPEMKKVYLEEAETRSFPFHYLEVVQSHKKLFHEWMQGVPVDIAKVRESMIPLLERIDELDMELFTLHQYGTAEDYLYHHSVAVSLLSAFLGKKLAYQKGEWIQIGLTGYLSDAGMTKIDPTILNNMGPLTEQQIHEVKNHPTYSYRMVEKLTGLSRTAKIGILQHHERLDGTGYPLGLTKDYITPFARIVAIADTYHAVMSERAYREKQSIFRAVDELLQGQLTKFDRKLVRVFIKQLQERALGKTVHLNNNQSGEIVFFDEDNPTKPLVRLYETDEVISLKMNSDLSIEEIIV